MTEFRYIFVPHNNKVSKGTCPSCKRKGKGRRYMDTKTNLLLDERYMKCDSSSCGYSYDPYKFPPEKSDFKSKKLEILPNTDNYNTLPRKYVVRSLENKYSDNLSLFLLNTFGDVQEVRDVLDKYCVGVSKALGDNSTIFWQVDMGGLIRSGKIIKYDKVTGKRDKTSDKPTSWVHSYISEDYKLQQTWFGAHLLKGWEGKIGVVESEKTALILAIIKPDVLWLASGAMYGLSDEKLENLKGRKVTFFPDLNKSHPIKAKSALSYDIWKERLKNFPDEKDWSVSDYLEKRSSILAPGSDLADIVLDSIAKQQELIN